MVYNFKYEEILVFTIFAFHRRGYKFFEPNPWCEFENMQNTLLDKSLRAPVKIAYNVK